MLAFHLLASAIAAAPVAPSSEAPCRVLSMSGGGSFGAFEAGVLARMLEEQPGLDYDYVLGVSAGSLNAGYLSLYPPGPSAFEQGVGKLKELWQTTKSTDVWLPRFHPLKNEPSLLSTAPLEKLLDRILAGKTVQRKVTIGSTDLSTGATARHDEDQLRVQPNLLLRATSAIPIVFPPVEINGSRHVDGGNSANVLTVHGIDRCDEQAKASGATTLPTIQIDVILAQATIPQVPPKTTTEWSLLQLASREFQIAKKQLFDHQLRFRCLPGVSSRITMTLRMPKGVIEAGQLAILNFDKGDEIWQVGYNKSRVTTTTFPFCL